MKKIEAVIRPEKLDEIKEKLDKIGIRGMTLCQVSGCGNQKGHKEYYRGAVAEIKLLPKVKLEIVAPDNLRDKIVGAILETAKTGEIGDGKIFVYNVDEVIRIRTGETGEKAI